MATWTHELRWLAATCCRLHLHTTKHSYTSQGHYGQYHVANNTVSMRKVTKKVFAHMCPQ